jgi:hypothetical protein
MEHRTTFILLSLQLASGHVSQNRLFSNDMILESREAYDIRPFVSGFGNRPGEKVTVSFVGKSYPTTVGADGTWDVQMDCCDKLTGKLLTVVGEENTLKYTNVACGQVFICGE